MIAGLEIPSSGAILSNSRDITKVPARSRNMGMVFQNYALFPHLDVFENIAFGMRTRRIPQATIEVRVQKALASVRMKGYERRSMHELSGGQQQRIALARALAIEPEVLLLDEPLSNLDPSLREELRDEIRGVIRELDVTTVFVTHDQQEAFALADRVAIMEAGVCHQVGKPEDVYNHPADAFVARFLGKANLLPATCAGVDADQCVLEIAPDLRLNWHGKIPERADKLLVFVRPENVIITERTTSSPRATPGLQEGERSAWRDVSGWSVQLLPPATITRVSFEGSMVNYTLDICGIGVNSRNFQRGQRQFRPGDKVQVELHNIQVLAVK
jgi:iron(III) transport system ATP-binding protein